MHKCIRYQWIQFYFSVHHKINCNWGFFNGFYFFRPDDKEKERIRVVLYVTWPSLVFSSLQSQYTHCRDDLFLVTKRSLSMSESGELTRTPRVVVVLSVHLKKSKLIWHTWKRGGGGNTNKPYGTALIKSETPPYTHNRAVCFCYLTLNPTRTGYMAWLLSNETRLFFTGQ